MRRRKRLPPSPKDDGFVNFRHWLLTPDEAKHFAQLNMDNHNNPDEPEWLFDPAYHWRKQTAKNKRSPITP